MGQNRNKRAAIIVNAYTTSQTELNQPRRLKEELAALGVETEILRNRLLDGRFCADGYDFCIYLDKDKYCARALGKKIRLFNRAEAVEICDDKMLTCLALEGFPMPETIAGALCYTPSERVSEEILDGVEARLGYPMIIKECYGSLGKGVYKADCREELENVAEQVKCRPHLFQKFIAGSCGRDVRAVVIGGEVAAVMERSSGTDFRSNAELGGTAEPFQLNEETEALCRAVAERLGLDYCGIDLLFGEAGFLVCEVNSNAFFGTIERTTGINVAKTYARHIMKTVYGEEVC